MLILKVRGLFFLDLLPAVQNGKQAIDIQEDGCFTS